MKYLCCILAFLVLTLAVQPVCMARSIVLTDCCPENSCSEEDENCCEGNKEHKACTNCNPFQMCGCCAFSIVPALQISIEFNGRKDVLNQSWARLSCPFVEEPVLGFWQPPKLS